MDHWRSGRAFRASFIGCWHALPPSPPQTVTALSQLYWVGDATAALSSANLRQAFICVELWLPSASDPSRRSFIVHPFRIWRSILHHLIDGSIDSNLMMSSAVANLAHRQQVRTFHLRSFLFIFNRSCPVMVLSSRSRSSLSNAIDSLNAAVDLSHCRRRRLSSSYIAVHLSQYLRRRLSSSFIAVNLS
jgi:hypothetical protein